MILNWESRALSSAHVSEGLCKQTLNLTLQEHSLKCRPPNPAQTYEMRTLREIYWEAAFLPVA